MNDLIILLIALTVHEFGHYIYYALIGFKPKFEWIGIGPCVSPQTKNIPVKDVIIDISIAIISGFLALMLLRASLIAEFAYIVGCFLDLNNLQMLLVYIWRKTITLDTNVNNIKIVVTK